MNTIRSLSCWLALGLLSVAAGFSVTQTGLAAGSKEADHSLAPSWELHDLNGKTIHSSDFKDKVVVLTFWATWCPPCRAEFPGFIALQEKYRSKGLTVIGVSVDQASAKVVKSFVQKERLNYQVVLADDNIATAFGGIEAIPATFVIDRQGRIVARHSGFAEQSEFEAEIKPLLK